MWYKSRHMLCPNQGCLEENPHISRTVRLSPNCDKREHECEYCGTTFISFDHIDQGSIKIHAKKPKKIRCI